MMQVAPKFNWFHILVVYLKTAPLFIGELFLLLVPFTLALALSSDESGWDGVKGLALISPFAGIGAYLVYKKARAASNAFKSLKRGIESVSTLANIKSTGVKYKHNRVRAYTFSYELSGQSFEYVFKSAHHRELKVGNKPFKIYFLPEDPKVCFIPKLYFKNEHKFDA